MKITLHDESIDIKVGQQVIFYGYHFSKDNQIEVILDKVVVDVIDTENNVVGFKNDVHASTLHFYKNDIFGERFFLSDTKENRLRFLKSRIKYYESQQALYDNNIEETYELLGRYIKRKREFNNGLRVVNNLIEQLSENDGDK